MKALLLILAIAAVFSTQPVYAIVSSRPAQPLDYPQGLLVVFFTIVCSALLLTLVMHYYRVQWGRRSLLME